MFYLYKYSYLKNSTMYLKNRWHKFKILSYLNQNSFYVKAFTEMLDF